MGTSAAATSVTSTGGGAGAWFCARVEQPAAAQRAARTAAQTDSESRLLLIVGLMLWLLRKCCVILYCARKAGAVAKRRLRTSVFREPPRFAFDNAARSPWEVARFDFPVFQNTRSAGEIQFQFGVRGGRARRANGFFGGRRVRFRRGTSGF